MQRHRIARATEFKAAFKSRKTDTVGLGNKCVCSQICRKQEVRATQPRLGRKPVWLLRILLSRVLDDWRTTAPVSGLDAILTQLNSLDHLSFFLQIRAITDSQPSLGSSSLSEHMSFVNFDRY